MRYEDYEQGSIPTDFDEETGLDQQQLASLKDILNEFERRQLKLDAPGPVV